MQFLLTKDELDARAPKADLDKARAWLAAMSLTIARLTKGHCIHDPHPVNVGRTFGGYCDGCGMASFEKDAPRCPFDRNFSK